jgi:hypothetical protein
VKVFLEIPAEWLAKGFLPEICLARAFPVTALALGSRSGFPALGFLGVLVPV